MTVSRLIAVQNGTVRGITDKTGHDKADPQQLFHILPVFQNMGASL